MASVGIIKFLDKYVGSAICLVLRFFPMSKTKKDEYKKILLIQLWGMGETILALPTIKSLRDNKKNITIDILVTERVKEVFYDNNNIDNVKVILLNPFSILVFILKNYNKYDLAIDMEEYLNISSILAFFAGKERIGYSHGIRARLYNKTVVYNDRQHVSQTFMDLLKPLGIKNKVEKLEKLSSSNDDKKKVDDFLKSYKIGKKDFLVGFGFGAAESAKSRMWPTERFSQLADYMARKYKAKIILIGNKNEKNQADNIINLIKNKEYCFNFSGKTAVREMFYLIGLCRLFIGNDSGPMHVAAAQGVKTIGLFGCNLPLRFKPLGKNNYYLYKKDSQNACINVHKGKVGECRYGMENACVKKIQVDDVVDTIKRITGKKKK